MGWTGTISVLRKRGSTVAPEQALVLFNKEAANFLELPGSEPLLVWAEDACFSEEHPGYEPIATGCSKVQSSINPLLSLWSLMRIARRLGAQLEADYLVHFRDDYSDFGSDARQIGVVDLTRYFLQGCVLAPLFLALNFRVLGE